MFVDISYNICRQHPHGEVTSVVSNSFPIANNAIFLKVLILLAFALNIAALSAHIDEP